MMCRVCGGRFDDQELSPVYDRHPYGDGYAYEQGDISCPDCGADLVQEGYCKGCGEEVPHLELEEGLCRMCVEETMDSLEWMWGALSLHQRMWACANTEWMTTNG